MPGSCFMEADFHLSQAQEVDQFAKLLLKHLREEINAQEQQQLHNWIAEHDAYKQVFDRINNEEQMMNDLQLLRKVNLDSWWQKISRQAIPAIQRRPLYRRWIFYFLIILLIAAAAIIIWYFFL